LGFKLVLFDFELSEQRLPGNVNAVPLILHTTQGAFVEFAEITNGRRAAEESMDVVFGRRDAFDGAENNLELLRQDAFDLEELILVFGVELLRAGEAEVLVELLPALEVALHLEDQLVYPFIAHNEKG